MRRRLGRELVLKVLYQRDLVRANPDRALGYLCNDEDVPEEVRAFAAELLEGVIEHQDELDVKIGGYAHDWRLERIAPVDRNIMRLAMYELLYRQDIPVSVSINEAVELAKAYGEEDSSRFVNGILGHLARHLAVTGVRAEGAADPVQPEPAEAPGGSGLVD